MIVFGSAPAHLPELVAGALARLARPDARTLRRGVLAGTAFGLTVSLGMTALAVVAGRPVCLDTTALDAVVSAAIGIATIGPLAAFPLPSPVPVPHEEHPPCSSCLGVPCPGVSSLGVSASPSRSPC